MYDSDLGKLSQEDLLAIMLDVSRKGEESPDWGVREAVAELKRQIMNSTRRWNKAAGSAERSDRIERGEAYGSD